MKKQLILLIAMTCLTASVQAMNLKESIQVAIKQNPACIAADKKAAAAGAKLGQAVSAFFPTINLNGDMDKAYTQPSTVQITTQTTSGAVTQNMTFGTDAAANISGIKAAVTQPVFVASLFPGYGIAKKGYDSASEDYKQTVIETSFNVSQAYFQVLQAQKVEALMRDDLAMSRAHREQVQSMLQAGVVTKADFLRSKVREANSGVSLIKAGYNIDLAKDAFNNTLGNSLMQPVALAEEGFTGKAEGLPEYSVLLEMAYKNRPDWKMCLLASGISEEQLRLSQSEYFPNIVLTANGGNQVTQYPTFQTDVNTWRVSGTGSWTLFDSLGRENRIKEAAENLHAQRSNVELMRNNIALEVRDAYLSLKSALDTVDATRQAVESAEESYKVAAASYNAGMGTNVDVLDAQTDLTQARTSLLQSLYDVEVAKAKINKTTGKVVM